MVDILYKTCVSPSAILEELKSKMMVAPRCSAFGQCGGCQLQHADYPLQLSLKAGLVRDAMTRLGGFAPELFENLECVPSPASLTTPRITPGERAQNHSPNSLHNIASRKYDQTPAE